MTAKPTASDPVVVKIEGFAFVPALAELRVAQPLVWHNLDAMTHTATRVVDPRFDTGAIAPGTTSPPITFDRPTPPEGIDYFCKPHPFMKGRLRVVGDADSTTRLG